MVGPVSNPDAFTLKATEDFTVSYEAGSPTAVYEAWRGAPGPGELTASGERLWKDVVPGVAMSSAVWRRIDLTSAGVRAGFFESMRATMPATFGVDEESRITLATR